VGKIIRSNRDLGAAIRLTRKQQKLRQVDVARKASVRQALVSDIENGATTARLDTVMRVLSALDLDLAVVPRRTTGFDPPVFARTGRWDLVSLRPGLAILRARISHFAVHALV
jgi:HTH-type transcriptional regulator/antitoxin HipB